MTPTNPAGAATIAAIAPTLPALDSLGDAASSALLVLPVFAGERPLTGLLGVVDWRLCGVLSRWVQAGELTGAAGERVLTPTRGRLPPPRVLWLGLGPRDRFRSDTALERAREAVDVAASLQATAVVTSLFGLDRIPSPLERTWPELKAVLGGPGTLERVWVVTEDGALPPSPSRRDRRRR